MAQIQVEMRAGIPSSDTACTPSFAVRRRRPLQVSESILLFIHHLPHLCSQFIDNFLLNGRSAYTKQHTTSQSLQLAKLAEKSDGFFMLSEV